LEEDVSISDVKGIFEDSQKRLWAYGCEGIWWYNGSEFGKVLAKNIDGMFEDSQKRLQEEQRLQKQIVQLMPLTDVVSPLLLTNARLRIQDIQEELKKHRIKAAVSGKVLLIRTHSINNNNRTIAIKLLVTE